VHNFAGARAQVLLNVGVPALMRRSLPTLLLAAACLLGATSAAATAQTVDPTKPAARDTTPVVLSAKELGSWSAPSNQTVQPPLMDAADCPYAINPENASDPTEGGASGLTDAFEQNCPEGYDAHNHYADPALDTKDTMGTGVPVDRLLGLRWNAGAKRFEQIPFQVDEQFTRYLDNSASGFAVYSGQDQHTTYAYEREGFRYDASDPSDPCKAVASTPTAADPVQGLDHNDELAFMASDAGPVAPRRAKRPKGIERMRRVAVTDPSNPGAAVGYVYVALAGRKGPAPAFDASNGYVRYERDASADTFAFSQSSYDNYGNAKVGTYCDEHGNPAGEGRRRPRDGASITTKRYQFRYDGRWLMTKIAISPDGGTTYGPDLVDRWKARAFAQDPDSETPCCGYEEEDNNWGGSSTLLGEKVGPVRAIRETWGADSGTNVIRRETFYRDEMKQKTWLRVHVIPPLDGIYAQWDFNAGRVSTFTNSRGSHEVDGVNDEAYGNFDDPCNPNYDASSTSGVDQGYRDFAQQMQLCRAPYHLSADLPDLAFGDPSAGTDWSLTAGPNGSIVDRITVDVKDQSPGGAAQSVAAVPYYRDDSCFDDGTGDNPGIDVGKRKDAEPRVRADGTTPRRCWTRQDGVPAEGTDEFFQGSIATHGVHLLFLADSDNARQTVPLTEIVNEWQMVMLPGERGRADGERYGRAFEKPLVAVVG
jgi:hypothetical protein